MTETISGLLKENDELRKRIERLEAISTPRWVFLQASLGSTSWDGDTYSTTAKTKIDLSSVFSAPAGIKAALFHVIIKDSASSGGDYFLILGPTNSANVGMATRLSKCANDTYHNETHIVPCDSAGDCYYQIAASGAGTMTVYLGIWGYYI